MSFARLPYGAQVLLAGSLAGLSPLLIAGKVYYCWVLAVVAIGFVLWPSRREMAANAAAAPLQEPLVP
jgi:hypothetical protein